MQNEFHQFLVFRFAEPFDERLRGQRDPELEGCETVFGEAVIEECGYVYGGRAELFLLLYEVGAADESDCHFVAEGGEEGQHFGLDALRVLCQLQYWQL